MPELIVRKWDGPYSFMIFREYGVYKARRGDTGEVQFKDPSPSVVLENAVNSLSQGETIIIKNDLELDSTVDLDLEGKSGFKLISRGVITGKAGIKNLFSIYNADRAFIDIIIDGSVNYKYDNANYAKDTAGLDSAVYVNTMTASEVIIRSIGFTGRGLEVDGDSKWNKFRLLGSFGQSIFAKPSTSESSFGTLWVWACEQDGAYIANWADIAVEYYENYLTGDNGVVFYNCPSLHIVHLAVGDNASPLITIDKCNPTKADHIYALGKDKAVEGVLLQNIYYPSHLNIFTQYNKGGYGLKIIDCRYLHVIHRSNHDSRGIYISATNLTETLTLELIHYLTDERAVFVDGSSGSVYRLTIRGFLRDCVNSGAAGESSFMLTGTHSKIVLDELHIETGKGDYFLDLPSGNDVYLYSVHLSPVSKVPLWNNPPKINKDGRGDNITENSGTATGTGAQQSIAHGCGFTPTKAQVIVSNIDDGANPYLSADPDATNIYVTAVSGKQYRWEVKMVP